MNNSGKSPELNGLFFVERAEINQTFVDSRQRRAADRERSMRATFSAGGDYSDLPSGQNRMAKE